MVSKRCLACLLLTIPLDGLAQDKSDDWPEGSAMNTGLAANERFAVADKALNATYKKLLKRLPEDHADEHPRQSMIAAQRTWIKYRDDQCDFVGEVSGGVRMWKSAYTSVCRADMTEARTKELKDLFDGEDK